MYQPDFPGFLAGARKGNLIPVYREVLSDMETPVSAFYKLGAHQDNAFLLESAEGGEHWGRYSFIGINPDKIFSAKGKRVEIREGEHCRKSEEADPIARLRELMDQYKPVVSEGLPERFFGGGVGYLGYDTVRFFEDLPDNLPDDLDFPDIKLLFCRTVLIFDNLTSKIKIVSNVDLSRYDDLTLAYRQATEDIESVLEILRKPLSPYPPDLLSVPPAGGSGEKAVSNMEPERYEEIVEKAQEYIRAGDIFQVVLSQRFSLPLQGDPLDVYRAARVINPSPYMFYLKLEEITLIGASPEVLVRLENQDIEVHPIAGTKPRGKTHEEDLRNERELLNSPKELAEHTMLLDLGRNDVGRVAEAGTVRVSERMVVRRYSHVMHLESNVKGKLKPGCGRFDVLAACFPAGTVSGAPKIRAMEIIDELEEVRRGPYAGAVGYFSYTGNFDTCIAIRTIVIKGDQAYVQAGAGIVADSIPREEYLESVSKARALLKAVEWVNGCK